MSDYWGIRSECGCVTAWMMGEAPEHEVRRFYREMAGWRDVQRTTSIIQFEALWGKLGKCPHEEDPWEDERLGGHRAVPPEFPGLSGAGS